MSRDDADAMSMGFRSSEEVAAWQARAALHPPGDQPATAGAEPSWPTMPPSKGQSHVLFEDGYAEGWAKCLEACKAAVADSAKPAGEPSNAKAYVAFLEREFGPSKGQNLPHFTIGNVSRAFGAGWEAALAAAPAPSKPEPVSDGKCPTCKGSRMVQVSSIPHGGFSFQLCRDCEGTGLAPVAPATKPEPASAPEGAAFDPVAEQTAHDEWWTAHKMDAHFSLTTMNQSRAAWKEGVRRAMAAPALQESKAVTITDEQILSCMGDKQPVRQHHGAAVFEYRLFALVDFARRVLALAGGKRGV